MKLLTQLVLVCVLVSVLCCVAGVAAGEERHPGRDGPEWSKWRAYKALQAWKCAIKEDPKGILNTWVGPNVCNYTGVFCSPPMGMNSSSSLEVVAGVDLNGANLKGCLVHELGLLRELGLLHLNSNRFFGTIPDTFKHLVTLFELDLSNNQFYGTFPEVVLEIPGLEFLDIRFNKFYGKLPHTLFSKKLDAIFVNNNQFSGALPNTFGNSRSSAIVLNNNGFQGGIPSSISNLRDTLQEITAGNNKFKGSLPTDLGNLGNLLLFDYSDNGVSGSLPPTIRNIKSLETFAMSRNRLTGSVTSGLCNLGKLDAVVLDDNFISGVDPACIRIKDILSLKGNCLPNSIFGPQKSPEACGIFCPPGYKQGAKSKKCYKYVKDAKNWDDAEFYCRTQSGGHLAAVGDWNELDDIVTMMGSNSWNAFVGGRKPSVSPNQKGWWFPWSSCVPFNHQFWATGEPDNKGGCETCLTVTRNRKLSDCSCDVLKPFVCALKRCDRVGCDHYPTLCQTMGDQSANCGVDYRSSVGYTCQCSHGFKPDKAGTCIPFHHPHP